MQIGDILVSSYGYNCTLVSFYRVKRVTSASVWLQRLENKWAYDEDGYGQVGKVLPSERETAEKPIMRRRQVNQYSKTEYVAISNYEYAYPWDGQAKYYNSLD